MSNISKIKIENQLYNIKDNSAYPKTGGIVDGNCDVEGNLSTSGDLKIIIPDEDYDANVKFHGDLDNNLGVIVTINGEVGLPGESPTQYRPIIRNIGTPNSNYDAANKKYVDDNTSNPNFHLVELNLDGSVKSQSSTLVYDNIKDNLTNPKKKDYLDIIWETGQGTNQFTRFYVPCVGISEVNNGVIYFIGSVFYIGNGNYMTFIFELNNQNILSTQSLLSTPESAINKVQSVIAYSNSQLHYPSTKAVFDEFQRKPVTIWETDSIGLVGLDANLSDNPSWQLTNLDFSPYKRVKIYTKANQKSGATASASTTPAVVLEMSLDPRAAGPYGGHYVGSVMFQKPNDSNRLATLTCAISADKTSFVVLRMTTLYGTAATSNSDVNAYVFKIEGYFD